MALAPFQWLGNQAVSSPEAAKRQRDIAKALMDRSNTPARNWAEGLGHITSALSGTMLRNRADEAEAAGRDEVAAILAGLGPDSSFSDITSVFANPWAAGDPGTSAVAQALLGQNLQRNDPMYQLQLQAAQQGVDKGALELDALRNPTSAPIKVGDVLVDPETFEPLFDARPDDLTSAIQNYQFLISQGVDPAAAQDQAFGGGRTVVNVGGEGQRMGTVPPGYAVVEDPSNPSGFRLEPIPGGPVAEDAAAAALAAEAQEGAQLTSSVEKADTVLNTTRAVLDLLDNSDQPTTGTLSRPFAMLSGTPAGKIRSYVSTLQSGVALGAMQRLKEASATGATGFGSLSAPELNLLISDIGALDPDTTEPEIFRATVQRIEDRTRRVVEDIKRNVSPERIQELGLQTLIDSFGDNGGQSQANPNIFNPGQSMEIAPGVSLRRVD